MWKLELKDKSIHKHIRERKNMFAVVGLGGARKGKENDRE
jgi:hypothetical protein